MWCDTVKSCDVDGCLWSTRGAVGWLRGWRCGVARLEHRGKRFFGDRGKGGRGRERKREREREGILFRKGWLVGEEGREVNGEAGFLGSVRRERERDGWLVSQRRRHEELNEVSEGPVGR